MTSIMPAHSRGIGIAGTAIAHGTLLALVVVGAHAGTHSHATVYEVNLVAAPVPSAGSKVVDPAPTAPKSVAPPVIQKSVKPAPKKPPAQAAHAQAAPAAKPAVVPAEGVKPSTGQSPVTLHQEGVVFPYQDYLDNIVAMINKRWNHAVFRPGLETKIAFVISKDGTVADASYSIEKPSGNSGFDEAAREAIESVVAHHEFGPLPSGFNGPSLSILFVFTQVSAGTP